MSPKFVPTAKRKVRVVGIVVLYTIPMNTYFGLKIPIFVRLYIHQYYSAVTVPEFS